MAYISTEDMKTIRDSLKAAFPEVKFSIRKLHHSTVSVTLLRAPFVFSVEKDGSATPSTSINVYHTYHYKNGEILSKMIRIIKTASKNQWFDKSDAQIDYFHTAFYIDINQGSWDKPFELVSRKTKKASKKAVKATVKATPTFTSEEISESIANAEFAAWTEMRETLASYMLNKELGF